jgi:hypothetical protein
MIYSICITRKKILADGRTLFSCASHIAHEWTTTPPTEPGMYQAAWDDGSGVVWVEFDGVVFGEGHICPADFSHWLGPIPLADAPEK